MTAAPVKPTMREALGLGLYRMLVNFALLLAAFTAFPAHKMLLGLAVIAFSQGIAAVVVSAKMTALVQNNIDDMAERKTRHTIVLAAERSGERDMLYSDFWPEVNRRVDDEIGRAEPEPSIWAKSGLVIAHVSGNLAADAVMLIVAFMLTPAF